MKQLSTFAYSIFLAGFVFFPILGFPQVDSYFDQQLWVMTNLNWKLNEKWTFNQDFAYQHTYKSPVSTRVLFRPQFNRQITNAFSLHGSIIFFYNMQKDDNNSIELRPWVGAKLNWPGFWRLDFSHYLRLEQRFEHTNNIENWENGFRLRYRIGSNLPINHYSLTDHTLYGLMSYEFYGVPFDGSQRFDFETTNRFDVGLGYWKSISLRYEMVVVGFEEPDEENGHFAFNNLVLFFKYKKYFNWE